MKIVAVETDDEKRFKDINQGDVFQAGLRIYMKIPNVLDEHEDLAYNAILLETGTPTQFAHNARIDVLKSELKVWR